MNQKLLYMNAKVVKVVRIKVSVQKLLVTNDFRCPKNSWLYDKSPMKTF